MRTATVSAPVVLALLLMPCLPARADAQSFGLGGRLGMVRPDTQADLPAERFTGGHVRARVSPRVAVEVALDLQTASNDALTERVREYPVQGSLLLFPVRAVVAPYLLGGGGWYTRRFQRFTNDAWATEDSTHRFGWHGGFGAELQLGRHAAAHADYRYTFLRFGDADRPAESGGSRFLPSYEGSMWTAGLTFYF